VVHRLPDLDPGWHPVEENPAGAILQQIEQPWQLLQFIRCCLDGGGQLSLEAPGYFDHLIGIRALHQQGTGAEDLGLQFRISDESAS
jgi:hypothetical protein